jgi:hypothetical protein
MHISSTLRQSVMHDRTHPEPPPNNDSQPTLGQESRQRQLRKHQGPHQLLPRLKSFFTPHLSSRPIAAFPCTTHENLLTPPPHRFKVMDDERLGDDLAAWACFRLDRLQSGLRMLHLYDSNGVVTKGVLLVRIRKTVSGAAPPSIAPMTAVDI